VAAVSVPKADGAVIRGGDEFFACGTEFDVHDCSNVVLEDVEGAVHLAHVKYVDVMVFVGDGEVEGLHRVPGDFVGGQGEDSFVEGRGGAKVVEDDCAIEGCGGEDGGFGLIEGDRGNGVGGGWPAEGLGGS